MPPPVNDLLARLSAGREGRLVHVEQLPTREADTVAWPAWVDPQLVSAYAGRGVRAPWRHQVVAADAAYSGTHVVLATGTASGKSLGYLAPALTTILNKRGPRGERRASALYLAPTKALAQDQLAAIAALGLDVRAVTHDGDSSREQREWTREHGEYLLTNPDMLHRSMLPGHERMAPFWSALRYVIVDECHHYRGLFGAHVAQIMRRIRRVAAHHGADPVFVLASATVAEPVEAARQLTGLDHLGVTVDGSPRGAVSIGLWEPPMTAYAGENGAPVRRAATTEAADLLADLVASGTRTLAFVPSRAGAERVAMAAAAHLAEVDASLPATVAAYRGGYLPEERRELEAALRSGTLLGMAATSALEMGIDIAGLDAVLMAGWPGTRTALWQQVGRAGRGAGDALGLLIARDDPLDTYLVHHPEAIFGAPVEATVFDPSNPYVLAPHLCAAAQEIPLTTPDLALFGPTSAQVTLDLVEAGMLRQRPRGWFWTDRGRAADLADIRSVGGDPVQLIEDGTGRVVGIVDADRAHSTAHTGAVYLHRGETWLVDELDLAESVAHLTPTAVDFTTTAREVTEISIVAEAEHNGWRQARLSVGTVEVSHQVVSYLRRRASTGEVIAEEPLDLPVRTLSTTAVWWTLPDAALEAAGLAGSDIPGAAHAAEHCSIGLLPLFATCDRWDIGGVSTARHPDTGLLTVFVYDGRPGGAGFAMRGYRTARAWLEATVETIRLCECDDGCPSCIQSPKCGNGNNPLDKAGAILLLDTLLS
ncbi:MAG: DEAD/DEAH box helicase [Nocardioides sp.]